MKVNYPPTPEAMGWASDFTDLRFFTEVLFGSPSVYSTVPADLSRKAMDAVYFMIKEPEEELRIIKKPKK